MRKIIVSMMVSLDGYFAGPNNETDWHVVDKDFNEFAVDQLNSADTLLFGRVTYQLMADYWPTPAAIKNDPLIAEKMNYLPKIVFSRTMEKPDWNNTKVIKGIIADEILDLKQQSGKDMIIFGSGSIVSAFIRLGLIDEFRILINPVILGSGRTLYKDILKRLNLKLIEVKKFKSGVVLLYYQPEKG